MEFIIHINSEFNFFDQNELKNHIRDLNLLKDEAELLGSRLKKNN